MEVCMGGVETKAHNCEILCEDSSKCRCAELEERNREYVAKIAELELQIGKRNREYEELDSKFKQGEVKRAAIEDELKGLKLKNGEVERSGCVEDKRNAIYGVGKEVEGVVDLTNEEEGGETVVQLMIEIEVLECEKKKAESDAEMWKEKFKEAALWISKSAGNTLPRDVEQESNEVVKGNDVRTSLDKQNTQQVADSVDAVANCNTPGTHPFMGGKRAMYLESETECGKHVRKQLSFKEERSPSKTIAPSTPAATKTSHPSVIDICDSDDEERVQLTSRNDQLNETLDGETEKVSDGLKKALSKQGYVNGADECEDDIACISTPKRKRAANIVTSDSESDEEDNVPLSKLKRFRLQKSGSDARSGSVDAAPCLSDGNKDVITRSKRRLMTLRESEKEVRVESCSPGKTCESKSVRGIPTTEDVEDSEPEDSGSESERNRMSDFIVDDSDESSDNASSHSNKETDGSEDFGEILSQLRRRKGKSFKWEFEADMLAAFSKDVELCMKAVCALYRRQTVEEKVSREALFNNGRGFSKFDAYRGSNLALFLTKGDPFGDVQKSVEQLQEHDSKGVKLCKTLASRYSKQLFEIYNTNEDPFFRPQSNAGDG